MNGLVKFAVGTMLLSTTLKFANENYEEIKAALFTGPAARVVAVRVERAAAERNALAARFLGVHEREHLFLDTAGASGARPSSSLVYARAYESWDGFAARAFGGDPDWRDAMVRIVQKDNGRQAWLGDLRRRRDGTTSGTVVLSDGHSMLRPGETYAFDKFEVWDWSIRSGRAVWGHWSLRLTTDQLPQAVAAQVRAGLSGEALPLGW